MIWFHNCLCSKGPDENFWPKKEQKTFFGRKNYFWRKKYFLAENNNFLTETFWQKKILAEKIFRGKTFWRKKSLAEKNFGRKNFGRKNFWPNHESTRKWIIFNVGKLLKK